MRTARERLTRGMSGRRDPDPPADADASADASRSRAGRRKQRRSPALALLRSGIFDAEYYAAAAGEVFPDRRTAAKHCLAVGMPARLSPTPFVSIGYLPRRIQLAWMRGNIVKVLDHLTSDRHRDKPFGPLFHPGVYVARLGPDEDLDASGPLAHFLASAKDDSPMPVPPGGRLLPPTYGDARAALLDHARLVDAQERDLPGTELSFHEAGASPWRRGRLPLPLQGVGGPLVTVVAPLQPTQAAASATELILQGQTLHRWELLLVGEDRGQPPVLHDGRARVVPLAPGADWRNAGLAEAAGTYVAFLMPGHHWRAEFLQGAVQWLHDSGHEAGHAAVSLHDATGQVTVMSGSADLQTLRAGGWIDVGTLVCTTEAARAVGGFEPGLGLGADPEFAIRLASRDRLDAFPIVASDRMVETLPRQQTTAAGADGDWLAVIGSAWVNWDDVRTKLAGRVAGRVSVVVPTFNDARMTGDAVDSLLATTSVPDIEVTVVDNGSPMELGQELTARFVGEPRVRYRRLPVNLNFAIACNVGFAESTGELVVYLNNDTRSDADWLPAVLAHLGDPLVAGAQPVLLYPDQTIQTAGTVFPYADGLACHFLTGRPYLDALPTAQMSFHAATAAALAMRSVDLAELEGFDSHYVNGMEDVDLCLRARELRPGGFRVEPRSLVVHLEGKTPGRGKRIPQNRQFFMERWHGRLPGPEIDKYERAGFTLVRLDDDGQPIPSPRPVIAAR